MHGPAGIPIAPQGLPPRMSRPPIERRVLVGRTNSAEGRGAGRRPVVPKLMASEKSTLGSVLRGTLALADDPIPTRASGIRSVITGAGGGLGSPREKSGTGDERGGAKVSRDPIPVLDRGVMPKSRGETPGSVKPSIGPMSGEGTLPKSMAALFATLWLRSGSIPETELEPMSPNPLPGPPKPSVNPPPPPAPMPSPSDPPLEAIRRRCRSNSFRAGLLFSGTVQCEFMLNIRVRVFSTCGQYTCTCVCSKTKYCIFFK